MNTGAITTLGRGGSDLTATVIGRAMGTREVQVWKDVDGVLTSNPLVVPEAKTIPFLTFQVKFVFCVDSFIDCNLNVKC